MPDDRRIATLVAFVSRLDEAAVDKVRVALCGANPSHTLVR